MKRTEELPLPDKPKFRFRQLKKKQLIIAGALFLGGLLLIQLLVWAALFYTSLKGGDLTLYVEADHEYLVVQHGEEKKLSYTLGAQNLPFCTAVCSWTITDMHTGAVIASGDAQPNSEVKEQYEATIKAPATGRIVAPYQFEVQCTNEVSRFCKSEGVPRHAAALTVVNVTYTEQEQKAYDFLASNMALWLSEQTLRLQALAGIQRVNDTRVYAARQLALAEEQQLTSAVDSLAEYVRTDDVRRARIILETEQPSAAAAAYEQAVSAEIAAANNYSALLEQQELLTGLVFVSNAQDRAQLQQALSAAALAQTRFYRQPLNETLSAFTRVHALANELPDTYADSTIENAATAMRVVSAEERMACVLKNTPCPAASAPPSTFAAAAQSLEQACERIAAFDTYFAAAQTAYAAELQPALTLAETEAYYNVSSLRTQSGFTAQATSIRAAARSGDLTIADPAVRLAVSLVPDAETLRFASEHCAPPLQFPLVNVSLAPSLPSAPLQSVSLPNISLAAQDCCVRDCTACAAEQHYPVVFLHGHSFADATAPEYNLYAFAPMAFALQEDGYLYAGHLFPRDDLDDIPYAELQSLPAPVLFTATYYYDSYPEEGTTSFVVQKSESIETYAIRLKEAVDVARHKTGQEKVVLVAHSMGGLVVRRYLQLFGDQNVAAVVLIATPNHGITDRTDELCPLLGGDKECADMKEGSVFLAKLNNGKKPSVPVFVIAGSGCEGRGYDGVVETESVHLDFANNTVITGTCPSRTVLLHSLLLEPAEYPAVYEQVRSILNKYT
jgi:hypothetical protein